MRQITLGYLLKEEVRGYLEQLGHEVIDLGAFNAEPSDYPDFAEAVGRALQAGRAERGILICGSGVGVCVAANKMPGIRACMCHDHYSAHQGVEHDNMNVLVLGARIIGEELAFDLVAAFLEARFQSQVERYVRRLNKVMAIEARNMPKHKQAVESAGTPDSFQQGQSMPGDAMDGISTILWDVGGVLLTNGWDRQQRDAVVARFGLDRSGLRAPPRRGRSGVGKG